MDFVAEGSRPKGRSEKMWKEFLKGDMKSLKINKEDALIRSTWRVWMCGIDFFISNSN